MISKFIAIDLYQRDRESIKMIRQIRSSSKLFKTLIKIESSAVGSTAYRAMGTTVTYALADCLPSVVASPFISLRQLARNDS